MLISSNTEAPRARPHISPAAAGQRPRNAGEIHFVSAESAIQLRTAPMPQSLSKVIIHVIFSTRDRYPWLDGNARSRMHACLATICRDAEAEAFGVGGVADHVHLIVTLPRTLSQAELVESLKKKSSKWIKELAPEDGNFIGSAAMELFPSARIS